MSIAAWKTGGASFTPHGFIIYKLTRRSSTECNYQNDRKDAMCLLHHTAIHDVTRFSGISPPTGFCYKKLSFSSLVKKGIWALSLVSKEKRIVVIPKRKGNGPYSLKKEEGKPRSSPETQNKASL